jgi:hypothetical protein
MTDLFNMTGVSIGTMIVGVAVIAGTVVTLVSNMRQRAALAMLEERVSQLSAGLSLLTNTSEEGFRSMAAEIGRLANSSAQVRHTPNSEPAKPSPKPQQMSARDRIALAAVGGRSVQEIAAAEQLSEGEVLLHMLMEKLRPETSSHA